MKMAEVWFVQGWDTTFALQLFLAVSGLCGCMSGWISSGFSGDWLRRFRRDLISSISMGQAVLGSAFSFLLQYYYVFTSCLSDSVVAFHRLVFSLKTSFLSLAPLLLSQILLFSNSKKLPILFLILCMFSPLFSFLLSPFPFFFFILSYSVWWKVLQCGARVPVVSMPTGCQAAARARSQGWETERQNKRERGFHRLHRTAFVPKSTATIPRTPANGTTQNWNTSQQNTKQLLHLDNIHTD